MPLCSLQLPHSCRTLARGELSMLIEQMHGVFEEHRKRRLLLFFNLTWRALSNSVETGGH